MTDLDSTAIAQRALADPAYRDGLEDAARVIRANNAGDVPVPSGIAAVYLDRYAQGEQP